MVSPLPAVLSGSVNCVNYVHAPKAEEDSTGVLAQLVIRDDVSKLPAHIAHVLENRVALLPFADKDGIWVDLRFDMINQSDAGFV